MSGNKVSTLQSPPNPTIHIAAPSQAHFPQVPIPQHQLPITNYQLHPPPLPPPPPTLPPIALLRYCQTADHCATLQDTLNSQQSPPYTNQVTHLEQRARSSRGANHQQQVAVTFAREFAGKPITHTRAVDTRLAALVAIIASAIRPHCWCRCRGIV